MGRLKEQSKLYQKLVIASLATSLTLTIASASAYAEVSTGSKSQATAPSVNVLELVPVRTVAEALGAFIEWDEKTGAAKVTKGSTVLILKIGEKNATLNGKTIDVGQIVQIVNGNMYVPLGFINQTFASHIGWNNTQNKMIIAADDYAALASSFLKELNQNNMDDAVTYFGSGLKQKLPPELLKKIWLGPQYFGHLKQQISAQVDKNAVHTNVTLKYATEKVPGPVEIIIRFDKNGLIDDFYIPPILPSVTFNKPSYDNPANYEEKEVVIGDGEFALPGTLTMPIGEGSFPVVILVQGAGPNDRDATLGAAKQFQDLAVGLANEKIAVLRYEKVTREHNIKVALNPKFTIKNETVDDAIRAVEFLKGVKGINPEKIFVAGHSQGGYTIPMIINEDKNHDIAGTIILAGPSEKFSDAIVNQSEELLKRLKSLGKPTDAAEQSMVMWSSIAKYVNDSEYSIDNLPKEFPIPQQAYWFFEQRNYTPAEVAKKQKGSMLILQGENDWQVPMAQFENWKKSLQNRQDVIYKTYPKVTHLLTEYDGVSTGADYYQPSNVPLVIINDIANWIKNVRK